MLFVDNDPQGSTFYQPRLSTPGRPAGYTLATVMGKVMSESPISPQEGILHHAEGVDLMPANIELSGIEVSLVNAMSRETILKQYLESVKRQYDYLPFWIVRRALVC